MILADLTIWTGIIQKVLKHMISADLTIWKSAKTYDFGRFNHLEKC